MDAVIFADVYGNGTPPNLMRRSIDGVASAASGSSLGYNTRRIRSSTSRIHCCRAIGSSCWHGHSAVVTCPACRSRRWQTGHSNSRLRSYFSRSKGPFIFSRPIRCSSSEVSALGAFAVGGHPPFPALTDRATTFRPSGPTAGVRRRFTTPPIHHALRRTSSGTCHPDCHLPRRRCWLKVHFARLS